MIATSLKVSFLMGIVALQSQCGGTQFGDQLTFWRDGGQLVIVDEYPIVVFEETRPTKQQRRFITFHDHAGDRSKDELEIYKRQRKAVERVSGCTITNVSDSVLVSYNDEVDGEFPRQHRAQEITVNC